MKFPFERIFRTLLAGQAPGEVVPELPPMKADAVEPSVPAMEIGESGDERPFHIFEAPVSGDAALIFVLPPNQPEGDDAKRSQRHQRRQRSKARELSRRAARRAKQSWQFTAAQ